MNKYLTAMFVVILFICAVKAQGEEKITLEIEILDNVVGAIRKTVEVEIGPIFEFKYVHPENAKLNTIVSGKVERVSDGKRIIAHRITFKKGEGLVKSEWYDCIFAPQFRNGGFGGHIGMENIPFHIELDSLRCILQKPIESEKLPIQKLKN